jgi:chorismate mutase/prephenate dehydrogenase
MTNNYKELDGPRKRIDEIDEKILDLLKERAETVKEVTKRKLEHQLPVFVPEREKQKSEAFKHKALSRGLDPEWAEDFLRMIMSSSRDSQSQTSFPMATAEPMHIVYIGGKAEWDLFITA